MAAHTATRMHLSEPGAETAFRLLGLLRDPSPEPNRDVDVPWLELDRIARQHRLRPWLHMRYGQSGCRWPVPDDLAAQWAEAHRRSALRALRQRAELRRLGRVLSEAGIRVTALKGAGYIWRGWIDPALRPMRDLDIIIEPGQAVAAHALLRQAGFTGADATLRPGQKHLPGLIAPTSGVQVEIHTRLIDAPTPVWEQRDAAFCGAALARARSADASRDGVWALTTTDMLLHVIAHAVLDHQFNNGPLFMLDMVTLIRHGDIEWPAFWADARMIGCTRACQLALRMTESFDPAALIDWGGDRPSDLADSTVMNAAALMLVDLKRRTELGAAGQIVRLDMLAHPGRLVRLVRRAGSTPASQTAGRHGPPASERTGLLQRLMAQASVLLDAGHRRHMRRSVEVARWLREDR